MTRLQLIVRYFKSLRKKKQTKMALHCIIQPTINKTELFFLLVFIYFTVTVVVVIVAIVCNYMATTKIKKKFSKFLFLNV